MLKDRVHHLEAADRERVAGQLAAALDAAPDVAFAYLYGSFAEGEPFHDVDVGVHLQAAAVAAGTRRDLELGVRLSDLIGLPVDVRLLNGAPIPFLFQVFRGRLLVSHDDDLLCATLEGTARQYLDIAPLLRQATREAFGP